MNLLQQIEKEHLEKLAEGKPIPDFRAGDTVRVHVKVVEGERERTQPYEGVVLGRKNRGINSSFRVRKIASGEGVERVFPLYSPNIRIEVIRHGHVRRAKLYYLRELTGKKARIAERSRNAKGVPLNPEVIPVKAENKTVEKPEEKPVEIVEAVVEETVETVIEETVETTEE